MSNEANIQSVIETIDTAISARFQLSQLLDGVDEAKNQVVFSSNVKLICFSVEETAGSETVSIAEPLQNRQHAQNP